MHSVTPGLQTRPQIIVEAPCSVKTQPAVFPSGAVLEVGHLQLYDYRDYHRPAARLLPQQLRERIVYGLLDDSLVGGSLAIGLRQSLHDACLSIRDQGAAFRAQGQTARDEVWLRHKTTRLSVD